MKHMHATAAFVSQVQQTITRHAMFTPDTRVLVALSGGLDSMVLLHVLRQLAYPVAAAHFDHQTRDGASAKDAAFVREMCSSLRIACYEDSAPVTQQAAALGESFENHARQLRYAFLIDAANKAACPVIATAHHQDDQAETVLMGLLGLASGLGIAGIAPVVSRMGVRVVRPLLECSRAAIASWAHQHDIPWRDDHTNRQATCTRNRVRLELLPTLEEHNPRVRTALARVADVLRVDGEYLDACATTALEEWEGAHEGTGGDITLPRAAFCSLPEALQRRIVRLLALRMSVPLTHERLVNAVMFIANAETGKRFELGNHVVVELVRTLVVFRTVAQGVETTLLSDGTVDVPGKLIVPGGRLETRVLSAETVPPTGIRSWCTSDKQYFDFDKVVGTLHVRARKPGDRMQPVGMRHTRKIQDIMVDRHIPADQRDTTPLLLMNNEILWVVGHVRSSHALVDATTTKLLEVALHHAAK